MDKITTNPRGLGSKSFKISHTHLLLSPYNPSDQEHNSNLLDTYERERIARDLEYYIHETAKSITTIVKFNGLTGNDRQSGLRRAMLTPRERYISGGGGGGMKNKSTEKKSKEPIKVSRPPERDTGGGGMKKSETERKGGGHRRAMSMPRVRETSVDGGGDGMKNKIVKKSKEITQASMLPERNTGGGGGGGGGGMKNKSEKKTKEITKASMPPDRDTGGGGGGMKKKSEKKNKEITKASGPPERDTSGGGGGGMMKKSETRRKAIIQGNFWLKHASTVCSTMDCDMVGFGRDFLRARMAARRPPGPCT